MPENPGGGILKIYKCNGYVNNAGRVVTLPVFL